MNPSTTVAVTFAATAKKEVSTADERGLTPIFLGALDFGPIAWRIERSAMAIDEIRVHRRSLNFLRPLGRLIRSTRAQANGIAGTA